MTAHALDPAAWRARRAAARWVPPHGAALLCVYRTRHVWAVERLVVEARGLGATVALWALEAVAPALAAVTVGCGSGPRVTLLNRLLETMAPAHRGPLVLADDDVTFVRGGLGILLAMAERCGFAIAQPAHAPGSHANHDLTRSRPLTLARRTAFVEIGPLVVIATDWRDRVVPFPPDFGMGWGLDLLWHDLMKEGARLGIVDAVTIHHLEPPGRDYDDGPERARVGAMMEARGLRSLRDIQHDLGAWRVWARRPPWPTSA